MNQALIVVLCFIDLSVDVMVTEDVFIVVFPIFLFYLQCRVEYLFAPANLCQTCQNFSLCSILSKNMGDQKVLSWPQTPNVQVMNINNPISLFEFFFDLSSQFSAGRWFHDKIITILDDWKSWTNYNDRENVGWDRVKIMPIVPFINMRSFVRAQKENEEGGDQEANTLNDIGWSKI